jgi:hypothetical protein
MNKYGSMWDEIRTTVSNLFDCYKKKIDRIHSLISESLEEDFFDLEAIPDLTVQEITSDIKSHLDSYDKSLASYDESLALIQKELLIYDFNSGTSIARKRRSTDDYNSLEDLVKQAEGYLTSLISIEKLIPRLIESVDAETVTIDGVMYVRICVKLPVGCKEFQFKSELLAEIRQILDEIIPCLEEILNLVAKAKRLIIALKKIIWEDLLGFVTKYIDAGVELIEDGVIWVADKSYKYVIKPVWSGITRVYHFLYFWETNDQPQEPEMPQIPQEPVYPFPVDKGIFAYNCPCNQTTSSEDLKFDIL